MIRREFFALLGSAAAAVPWPADGEPARPARRTANRLAGAWRLVSSVGTREDGSTFNRWGPDPKGIIMFDGAGNFAQIITGPESFVFGAKNFCAFGTYSVDETGKTIITRIEGSSLSRISGTVQRRVITSLTADELRYVNFTIASAAKVDVVWKRSK